MASTTVSSILRARQAYCIQLCEKQTLTHGIAYWSDRFAALPDTCQFREVTIEDRTAFSAAFDEADRHFHERGLTCLRWAPAVGQPTEPLTPLLEAKGYRRRTIAAMVLKDWVDLSLDPTVRVLPARAMRPALRATFDSNKPDATLAADAMNERLDDPHLDIAVAMVDSTPAGHCGLHEVGDIGRILVPTVLPAFRDSGVPQALLAHALTLVKRLAMRTVCACVDADDSVRIAWLEEAGFVGDGTIVEFERVDDRQT